MKWGDVWRVLAVSAGFVRGGEMVLVDETQSPAPIVAEAAVAEHARGLARYLSQISGRSFEVVLTNRLEGDRSIWVERLGEAEAVGMKGDSFLIECRTNKLRIAGITPAATGFGVYAFLEEMLGCRWWSADEEEVPTCPVIRIPETNRLVQAVFTQTILMNREAQNRMNGFEYKARVRTTEVWSGGHTLYPLLTPYAETNREFYPYNAKTGERGPNNLHFCYSAPGIAEALADALEKEIQKRKGNIRDVIYMAGMGDWYGGGCECPRCRAINLEEGWTDAEGKRHPIMGGTNLRMMNRAAELLEARHPGVKVGFMAYMSMEAPPTLTVPRSNVYVRIPHLRHCIIHGVRQCAKNEAYNRNLRRWVELAPGRVHVWDYGVNFGDNFMYPFPVLFSIAGNIQYYAELGVAGVLIQGNYVSTGGDLVVLKNYVWRRLLWDPGLDPLLLSREFCLGYYGPAAKSILDYVLELERSVEPSAMGNGHLDEFVRRDGMRKSYLTPERESRLRDLLAEARTRAAGREPYARRVEEVFASLEAFALWHPGPLAEVGDRLVRADLDNAYTYDRAVHASFYSRKASAREWGPYLGYQLNFLALQGGPLGRVKSGTVEVTAAPALAMRIRQITWNGRPLLHVPNNPNAKGWPNLGGAYEQVRSGWISGAFVGEPAATQLFMKADAISQGNIRQTALKTITVEADGTIRITVNGRRISREAGYEVARATLVTEYQAGKGNAWRVEGLGPSGDWNPLLTSGGKGDAGQAAGETNRWEAFLSGESLMALRVVFPSWGCAVEERCPLPGIVGGRMQYEPLSGVLRTSLQTATNGLEFNKDRVWLERLFTVRAWEE